MADYDNGLPPEGTDISDDRVGSVAFGSTADSPEDTSHIGSVAFGSEEDNPEDTSHIGSVAYDVEESGDTPLTIQVICDDAWEVASFPEWVWPDTLSGNGNGTIDIAVYKNTGHERTGKIVVQTIDGLAKAEHTVTQEAGGTVYIADINTTMPANPAFTSGRLLLENVRVNRHDSELIDEIGPFSIPSGQSVRQQISYSSLEPKPDAITCTVWVANIVPVPANRQVNILSAGVPVGVIITDVNGLGSMEMTIPVVNTGMDNYTLELEVSS
ncbi:BACON domain-containing protein [Dysgonomonas sp. GY75]|uniref:BACON domain-containing protein n=1 Tax=Dysgonomonas sp. GY75 TaxID=2780419 RepID=UPI001883E397|nr:BACON domain-containing protein [Dysgonomonas sp. GY75]MBF0649169.1 BACON domain-containing protein [Dysgonomonas sp. GY75]